MNREEILNMEAGEQLDNLVAEKVMGWHIKLTEYGKDWVDDDDRYMTGVNRDGQFEDDEDFHLLHWHPSGSILWAWEVIEKLMPIYQIDIEAINKMFKVSFDDYARTWEATAEDAPVAICKSALLAVMENENMI